MECRTFGAHFGAMPIQALRPGLLTGGPSGLNRRSCSNEKQISKPNLDKSDQEVPRLQRIVRIRAYWSMALIGLSPAGAIN